MVNINSTALLGGQESISRASLYLKIEEAHKGFCNFMGKNVSVLKADENHRTARIVRVVIEVLMALAITPALLAIMKVSGVDLTKFSVPEGFVLLSIPLAIIAGGISLYPTIKNTRQLDQTGVENELRVIKDRLKRESNLNALAILQDISLSEPRIHPQRSPREL